MQFLNILYILFLTLIFIVEKILNFKTDSLKKKLFIPEIVVFCLNFFLGELKFLTEPFCIYFKLFFNSYE